MNTYRIMGNENDVYSQGPIWPNVFLGEVKAKSPTEAANKYYRTKGKRLNWPLYRLTARLKRSTR